MTAIASTTAQLGRSQVYYDMYYYKSVVWAYNDMSHTHYATPTRQECTRVVVPRPRVRQYRVSVVEHHKSLIVEHVYRREVTS